MNALASIIIPCGPDHEHLLGRAVASAEAQTVPCEVITVIDHDRRGPGWARNQGAVQANGLFYVFLDADDELEAGFVQTLAQQWSSGHATDRLRTYLYSDWTNGDGIQRGPECEAWVIGDTWHPVTTLLPAHMFRVAGGFDETLPAIEDRDFYLKLRALGFCGRRVAEPLLRYHADGHRSESFRHAPQPERDAIMRKVNERYRGRIIMGCCNDNVPLPQTPQEERQPGDVLAQVLYAPATQVVGGRFYKRPRGQGDLMWVAREHAQARPTLWRIISDPEGDGPDIDTVLELAGVAV